MIRNGSSLLSVALGERTVGDEMHHLQTHISILKEFGFNNNKRRGMTDRNARENVQSAIERKEEELKRLADLNPDMMFLETMNIDKD